MGIIKVPVGPVGSIRVPVDVPVQVLVDKVGPGLLEWVPVGGGRFFGQFSYNSVQNFNGSMYSIPVVVMAI